MSFEDTTDAYYQLESSTTGIDDALQDAVTWTESVDDTTEVQLDDCDYANSYLDEFTWKFFPYSLVVVIGLGFVVRRKALCLKCCWGRPGFPQPIDFIEETGRRWAYAAVFVIVSYDIITLFLGNPFWPILVDKDKDWLKKFAWVKVFIKLLDALSVCLVYYPLLAFIDHRRSIVANVLGVVHVIPWISVYSFFFNACRIAEQKQKHGATLYILRIPVFVAFFVAGFSYILDFAINVHRWRKERAAKIHVNKMEKVLGVDRNYKMGHHFEYVSNLLRKRVNENVEEGNGVKLKLKKVATRVKYQRMLGFRYSTRLICCVTICTTVLIWFVVLAIDAINSIMDIVSEFCNTFQTDIGFIKDICTSFTVVNVLAHFASAFSAFLIFMMLVHTMLTYKRRWHQLLRGDHSWHMFGEKINAPQSTLLSGLKYGGFQVAFVIWGWIVLTFFLFVILMFVSFAFIIPMRQGVRNWLIQKLVDLWPTLLLGIIIIPLIQKLICRFLFLQEKGTVLALTNRRLYNAASYYFLVLNIIVGIFACLKRILIPLVLGIAFLSRLDQPLIMRGFESFDPGYVSFVSMLLVDLHHNHPVIKTFVELLIQVRKNQQDAASGKEEDDCSFSSVRSTIKNEGKPSWTVLQVAGSLEPISLQEKQLRSKRIRNRWWKIVTLVNNPSLALKALEERLINERDQGANQISQDSVKIENNWNSDIDFVKDNLGKH